MPSIFNTFPINSFPDSNAYRHRADYKELLGSSILNVIALWVISPIMYGVIMGIKYANRSNPRHREISVLCERLSCHPYWRFESCGVDPQRFFLPKVTTCCDVQLPDDYGESMFQIAFNCFYYCRENGLEIASKWQETDDDVVEVDQSFVDDECARNITETCCSRIDKHEGLAMTGYIILLIATVITAVLLLRIFLNKSKNLSLVFPPLNFLKKANNEDTPNEGASLLSGESMTEIFMGPLSGQEKYRVNREVLTVAEVWFILRTHFNINSTDSVDLILDNASEPDIDRSRPIKDGYFSIRNENRITITYSSTSRRKDYTTGGWFSRLFNGGVQLRDQRAIADRPQGAPAFN